MNHQLRSRSMMFSVVNVLMLLHFMDSQSFQQDRAMCELSAGFSVPPPSWLCVDGAPVYPVCTNWEYITCDSTATFVLSIGLSGRDIAGTLSSAIGSLANLTSLDLTGNNLSGDVPTEICLLNRLRSLKLCESTPDPACANITSVPLCVIDAPFSILPDKSRTALRSLQARMKQIGQIPCKTCRWLCDVVSSAAAGQSPCTSSGIPLLPVCGGKLLDPFFSCNKYGNVVNITVPGSDLTGLQFLGTVSDSLQYLTDLKLISLMDNLMHGSIPSSIGLLSGLTAFIIESTGLEGNIPSELGGMSEIKLLKLRANSFSGSIPAQLAYLPKLQYLNLANNHFSGSLPTAFCETSASLIEFQLCNTGNCGDLTIPYCFITGKFASMNGLYAFSTSPTSAPMYVPTIAISPNTLEDSAMCELSAGFSDPPPSWLCVDGAPVYPVCTQWENITCNATTNSVIAIKLSGAKTYGTLSSAIGSLANLTSLDLTGNNLSGDVPTEICLLNRLRSLKLCESTPDPACANITSVPLCVIDAPFSILPDQSRTALRSLQANKKQIGQIPCRTCRSLCDLASAALTADVTPCSPLGVPTMPVCGGKFLDPFFSCNEYGNLVSITASGLGLSGTLSESLQYLTDLRQIAISGNLLHGGIPTVIGLLSNLQVIIADSNKLQGSIPSDLGRLSSLMQLSLRSNTLTGTVPSEVVSLPSLQIMTLDGNSLSGPLPPRVGVMTRLTSLDISSNALNGSLPSELGSLSSMKLLNLAANSFSGSIPAELALLPNIEYLNVANQSFSGLLSTEFCETPFSLKEFYLCSNGNCGNLTIPYCFATGKFGIMNGLYATSSPTIPTSIPSSPAPISLRSINSEEKFENNVTFLALVIALPSAAFLLLLICFIYRYCNSVVSTGDDDDDSLSSHDCFEEIVPPGSDEFSDIIQNNYVADTDDMTDPVVSGSEKPSATFSDSDSAITTGAVNKDIPI